MNILHLISQHPDSTGSGIYLQAMLEEAARHGHRNHLIAAANSDEVPDTSMLASSSTSVVLFDTRELPFALPGMSDIMPYRSSIFKELDAAQIACYEEAFLRSVRTQLETFTPDIIHSHHLWLLSALVKNAYPHISMVTSCHGSDLRQFQFCPHLQNRVKHGCRNIDGVLALSHAQLEEIVALYGLPSSRITVIGAGFNDTLFRFAVKEKVPPVHIIYCGKLSRAKGVPFLLRAMQQLDGLDYHLHLVGKGSGVQEAECRELAKKLRSRITLYGVLGQNEVAALFRKAHLFVLPSLYEGLPLVILEALACGCRVIATRLPGCLSIGESVTPALISFIAPPRLYSIDTPYAEDEDSFVVRIAEMIKKEYRSVQNGMSADETTINENVAPFSRSRVFARIERIYRKLL